MSKRKLFHGTMNSSKTAQLLMQAYNLERQGKTFLIFKPSMDTRDVGIVKSRALTGGRVAQNIGESDAGKIRDLVTSYNPDFIFVDELQFFTESQVEEFSRVSVEMGIPVFAYGLIMSYTGKMFDSTKKAIESGFTLHELKMQCDLCRSKSTHHLLYIDGKLVMDGSGFHVGDQEYRSVCYPCFLNEADKHRCEQ